MLDSRELETLIAHEARYFEIWSRMTRSPQVEGGTSEVWFLDSETLPHYHSANRALHPRLGNSPNREKVSRVTAEIIAHYRARGLPVVADVDPIAEEQGFGRELRRRGVTPVIGSTLLMRYEADCPPIALSQNDQDSVLIQRIPNETGQGEARDWVHLAGADEEREEDAVFWRKVAELEARSPDCRLYLATLNGQAVGACQLFSAFGWAQIDSVMTHPDFRRRGIASRLVAQAVRASFALGNQTTYLFTERGGAGEQVYRRLGFNVWGVDVLRRHLAF